MFGRCPTFGGFTPGADSIDFKRVVDVEGWDCCGGRSRALARVPIAPVGGASGIVSAAMASSGPMPRDHAERRVGALLRDKYRIEQVIGAGGMATVYRAVHRNGHRVAVKILRLELSVDDAHRERFVREAYVANSLAHPGAVPVIDDDVAEDGCPFLVMDLLVGETLEQRRRRLPTAPAREVLALGHALCDVLARAHERGVVHRDIKPDNIFLTAEGALKVLDFGIARVRQDGHESATRTGHLLGTPAFMAPEQALGRRHAIDGRTDLWAVGATMFTLLTGRHVHHADTPEEVMVRAATEHAPPLAQLVPAIPPAIAALVDRALATAQADRYPDARAMQAAIAAAHHEAFDSDIRETPLPRGLAAELGAPPLLDTAETLSAEAGALTVVDHDTLGSAAPAEAPASRAAPLAPPPRAPTPAPTQRPRSLALRVAVGLGAAGLATAAALLLPAIVRPASTDPPPPPAPERAPACTSHAACAAAHPGAPAICRRDQSRCVVLTSERCSVLADPGDLENDATLWIGAMYPLRDPGSEYGPQAHKLVELARRDFAGLTGGLPPTRPGGPPRPIGVVACDDTDDFAAVARHLVDDVGVPAILGFARSKEVLDLASSTFVPRGVLALASNTAAMLSSIPHPPGSPRLVYRVTTSAAMVSPAVVAFLREVQEPQLRRPRGPLGPDGSLRIAIVRNTNASGTSHSDALFTALAARPARGPEEVQQFTVDDERSADVPTLQRLADDLAGFAPHVILDAGAGDEAIVQIERRLADAPGPRPRYIYGGVDVPLLGRITADHPDFAARFFMVHSRENAATAKLTAHYVSTFAADRATRLSASPYDAFYVLAYAAMALGDAPITGPALAGAIRRLVPPGAAIDVGPAGIYPAFKALSDGHNIDLGGTFTTLDFDPVTGDATADFSVLCLDPRGVPQAEVAARYDGRTGQLVSEGRCAAAPAR
jgi:serine/threonine protein kinase/ABC-type branched-subunit amino acid transport system substrate-binding protein